MRGGELRKLKTKANDAEGLRHRRASVNLYRKWGACGCNESCPGRDVLKEMGSRTGLIEKKEGELRNASPGMKKGVFLNRCKRRSRARRDEKKQWGKEGTREDKTQTRRFVRKSENPRRGPN